MSTDSIFFFKYYSFSIQLQGIQNERFWNYMICKLLIKSFL